MKINDEWLQLNGKYKCPYCEKEYSKKGISSHIFRSHTEEGQQFKPFKDKVGPWANKKISESHKKNISNGLKNSNKTIGKCKDPQKEIERRMKISKNGKGKIGGYRKGSGRGKSGWYKNYWCDSSWELAFVIYNLEHNIPFKRNTEKFEYKYENNIYNYIPDFIMSDGYYVEIKGYETEQTFAKYQSCNKLIILKEKDLKHVFEYVINKYGKDFIKLYEK